MRPCSPRPSLLGSSGYSTSAAATARLLALVLDARPGVTAAVGLDSSEPSSTRRRARFSDDGHVTILEHAPTALPRLGTFDLVVSGFAIHHLEDDREQSLLPRWPSSAPRRGVRDLEVVRCATPELDAEFNRRIGRPGGDPEDRLAPVDAAARVDARGRPRTGRLLLALARLRPPRRPARRAGGRVRTLESPRRPGALGGFALMGSRSRGVSVTGWVSLQLDMGVDGLSELVAIACFCPHRCRAPRSEVEDRGRRPVHVDAADVRQTNSFPRTMLRTRHRRRTPSASTRRRPAGCPPRHQPTVRCQRAVRCRPAVWAEVRDHQDQHHVTVRPGRRSSRRPPPVPRAVPSAIRSTLSVRSQPALRCPRVDAFTGR